MLRYTSVVSAGRAEAQKQELLCRWPDLRAERTLPPLPDKVKEQQQQALSAAQAAAAAKSKETLDQIVVRFSKEGGLFALVRHGVIAIVVGIVAMRIFVHVIVILIG